MKAVEQDDTAIRSYLKFPVCVWVCVVVMEQLTIPTWWNLIFYNRLFLWGSLTLPGGGYISVQPHKELQQASSYLYQDTHLS